MVPAAVAQQSEIDAKVREVEDALKPDVRHIRYEIGEDWSGQWAIFFRIVMSDEALRLHGTRRFSLPQFPKRIRAGDLARGSLGVRYGICR
jgi:hypothetical protein